MNQEEGTTSGKYKNILEMPKEERIALILKSIKSDEYYLPSTAPYETIAENGNQVAELYFEHDRSNPIVTKYGDNVFFEPDQRMIERDGYLVAQAKYCVHIISSPHSDGKHRQYDSQKSRTFQFIMSTLLDPKERDIQHTKTERIVYLKKVTIKYNCYVILSIEIGEDGNLILITFLPEKSDAWIEKRKASGYLTDASFFRPYTEKSSSDIGQLGTNDDINDSESNNKDTKNNDTDKQKFQFGGITPVYGGIYAKNGEIYGILKVQGDDIDYTALKNGIIPVNFVTRELNINQVSSLTKSNKIMENGGTITKVKIQEPSKAPIYATLEGYNDKGQVVTNEGTFDKKYVLREFKAPAHAFAKEGGKAGREIIILDSPAVGQSDGVKNKHPYRFIIDKDNDNPLNSIFKVQYYNWNQWNTTPGQWYLGTLLDAKGYSGNKQKSDFIWIDMGGKWGVYGLKNALEEAKQKLNINTDTMEQGGQAEYHVGQKVTYIPNLTGLDKNKPLIVENKIYSHGDEFTSPGYYYTFENSNLRAHQKDLKPFAMEQGSYMASGGEIKRADEAWDRWHKYFTSNNFSVTNEIWPPKYSIINVSPSGGYTRISEFNKKSDAIDFIKNKKGNFVEYKMEEGGPVPLGEVRLINSILDRKKNGVDNTETESAEIKGFIKDHLVQLNTGHVKLIEKIQTYFPIEYGEALDEMENKMASGGKSGSDKKYVIVSEKNGTYVVLSKPASKTFNERHFNSVTKGQPRGEKNFSIMSVEEVKKLKSVIGDEYLEDGGSMDEGGEYASGGKAGKHYLKEAIIEWQEGPVSVGVKNKSYDKWEDLERQVMAVYEDGPGYNKTKIKFVWDNGAHKFMRIDVGPSDWKGGSLKDYFGANKGMNYGSTRKQEDVDAGLYVWDFKKKSKKELGGLLLAGAVGLAAGAGLGYGYRDSITKSKEEAIAKAKKNQEAAKARIEAQKKAFREKKEKVKRGLISGIERLEHGGKASYDEGGLIGKKIRFNQEIITDNGILYDSKAKEEITGEIVDKAKYKGNTVYIIQGDETGDLFTLELTKLGDVLPNSDNMISIDEVAEKYNGEEEIEDENNESEPETNEVERNEEEEIPQAEEVPAMKQGGKTSSDKKKLQSEIDALKKVIDNSLLDDSTKEKARINIEKKKAKISEIEAEENTQAKVEAEKNNRKKVLESEKKLRTQSSNNKSIYIDVDKSLKTKMRNALREQKIPYKSKSSDGIFRIYLSNKYQLDIATKLYNEKREKANLPPVDKEEVSNVVKKRHGKLKFMPAKRKTGVASKLTVEKKRSSIGTTKMHRGGLKGKIESDTEE